MRKRGADLDKLKKIIQQLLSGEELDERHRDHALSVNWSGRRDCHIQPDWLLIYRRDAEELRLERTGSHSDLF